MKMVNSVTFAAIMIKYLDMSDLRKCYVGLQFLEIQPCTAGKSVVWSSWLHGVLQREMCTARFLFI